MSRKSQRRAFAASATVALALGTLCEGAEAQSEPSPRVIYAAKVDDGCGRPFVNQFFAVTPPPPPGLQGGVGPILLKRGQIADGQPAEVTGAPFSAVGTSEIVQTLADGNRIVHTNTTRYFRDSSGRTRTEHSLTAVGPFALEESRTIVMINDPVAGKYVILHPDAKQADVLSVPPQKNGESAANAASPGVTTVHCSREPAEPATRVSLGQKTLYGLKASGTRLETTIPAGAIGNEQPITVSSEEWVSNELHVVLSSTRHDPMIGDTNYHLDHIDRAEPDPSLFTTPADYTVQNLPGPGKAFVLRAGPPAEPASGPK
jgi:hypothetical protein